MTSLEPLNYRVLIKPKKTEEKTSGGIYLPDSTVQNEKRRTFLGRIVALGPDADVGHAKVGDAVIYAPTGGKFINDPGTGIEYFMVNDEDCQCVVPGVEVE